MVIKPYFWNQLELLALTIFRLSDYSLEPLECLRVEFLHAVEAWVNIVAVLNGNL